MLDEEVTEPVADVPTDPELKEETNEASDAGKVPEITESAEVTETVEAKTEEVATEAAAE